MRREAILRRSLLAAIGLACSPFSTAFAQITVSGAGGTFPAKIYSEWFDAYAKIDPSVRFTYQDLGSGAGQKLIIGQAVDFGASDDPMSDDTLARAPRKILQIPTIAGAVAISFNLPSVHALRLDGPTLADIFLGKITHWTDPQIAQQNPGVTLPETDIVVVHRSDSSGTSFIFTDFLNDVSPDWKNQVGKGATVVWPVGLSAIGNEGVSAKIKETPGSIGYFELAYVRQNQLPFADIKNRDGYYVEPSPESVTNALATASIPDDFRFSMVNAPGSDSYPIASVTWLLIYEKAGDPVKGRKLLDFLKWAETDGQKIAPRLTYAPLPETLRTRILTLLSSLRP